MNDFVYVVIALSVIISMLMGVAVVIWMVGTVILLLLGL